jgi:hypothetical protein
MVVTLLMVHRWQSLQNSPKYAPIRCRTKRLVMSLFRHLDAPMWDGVDGTDDWLSEADCDQQSKGVQRNITG